MAAASHHPGLALVFSGPSKGMGVADLLHSILLLSEQGPAVALSHKLDMVLVDCVRSRLLGRSLTARGLRRSI